MKPITLLAPLALACPEPPSRSGVGAGVPSIGAAAQGAPNPGPDGSVEVPAVTPQIAVVADSRSGAHIVPPREAIPQDQLTDGVTISGALDCGGCEGPLLVRVEDGASHPPQLLTSAIFAAPGAYQLKAPRDKKVVLLIIHDVNGDGRPTPGEGVGLWTGGLLDTAQDATDVNLTIGLMPEAPPIVPDGGAGADR